jgi:hypothetical protein
MGMEIRDRAGAEIRVVGSGESIRNVATSASTGVNDLKGFGTVMGAGIVTFCPSQTEEMKQFLTAIGQVDQAP